jgi:hypothetical protein
MIGYSFIIMNILDIDTWQRLKHKIKSEEVYLGFL